MGRVQGVWEAQVLLGGAGRGRYQIELGGGRRWIRCLDNQSAWVRAPGSPEAQALGASARAELAEAQALRWLLLRFPWDFREALTGLEEPPEVLLAAAAPGGGEVRIVLDPETLLPCEAGLGGSQVRIVSWKRDRSGVLQPEILEWGRLREHWLGVETHVLLLDSAFRADPSPREEAWAVLRATPGSRPREAESLDLVERPELRVLELGEEESGRIAGLRAAGTAGRLAWRRYRSGRPAGWLLPLREGGEPPRGTVLGRVPAGTWIRWRTAAALAPAEAEQRLLEALGPGWNPAGPLLSLEDPGEEPRLREYLLPVARRGS